jgi:3-hydroxyisobutyrate dehydrogenase-like beta-hydroxyacid dehydrogenase
MSKVAVVGLGAMGSRIAARLLATGQDVVVWNRSAEKASPLVERGASRADSPAAAAREAEAVFVMVADPAALEAVTEGSGGVLAGARPGTTIIQMSTVGPAHIAALAAALPDGVELLDAPVLGGLTEVEAGTLRMFAAGEASLVERWKPLLSALGTVLHVGPVGAGASAKLVANSALLSTLAALGEALALARTLGLSTEDAFDVLSTTPLAAQAERRRDAFSSDEYPLRFELGLARKDGDLITAAAEAAGVDAKVARAVADWFAEAEQAGERESDYSAILRHIAERA